MADEGRAEQAADRVSAIAALRRADPDAGRALVEQTWDTDGAQHRAAALAALLVGSGPADEPFLERCLDDRAEIGARGGRRLLDRLPGSARAARMADRLRPLLSTHGTLRKHLEVELPDDPDAAGVRDGLPTPGPGVSQARPLAPADRGAARRSRCGPRRRGPSRPRCVAMMRPDDALVVPAR